MLSSCSTFIGMLTVLQQNAKLLCHVISYCSGMVIIQEDNVISVSKTLSQLLLYTLSSLLSQRFVHVQFNCCSQTIIDPQNNEGNKESENCQSFLFPVKGYTWMSLSLIECYTSRPRPQYTILFLYTIGIAVYQAAFGQLTGPVSLGDVRCTGNESSLLSCSHRVAYCSHFFFAGVVCHPCKYLVYQ